MATIKTGVGSSGAGILVASGGQFLSAGNTVSNNGLVDSTGNQTFVSTATLSKGDMIGCPNASLPMGIISVGSDGQYFISDSAQTYGNKWGALPTTEPLMFLGKLTASSSSTLSQESNAFTPYQCVMIVLDNVLLSSTSATLGMRFASSPGTYISTGYVYALQGLSGSTVVTVGSNSATQINLTHSNVSATSNQTINMIINLFPNRSFGLTVGCNVMGSFYDSSSNFCTVTGGGSLALASGSPPLGVRFLPSTGTITSGNIYFYGTGNPF